MHVLLLPPGYCKNCKVIMCYVKELQTGKIEYVQGPVEAL